MAHPFERLLLATEHTEFDRGAETIAFALAARCGLPLAGVMPLVSNAEYEAQMPALAARADAEAGARADAVEAEAQRAGVALTLRVRRGDEPFEQIVAEARERGADLIVARRRGRRGFLAKLMFGEMVGKVVAHAPCSVLLCPRTPPRAPLPTRCWPTPARARRRWWQTWPVRCAAAGRTKAWSPRRRPAAPT